MLLMLIRKTREDVTDPWKLGLASGDHFGWWGIAEDDDAEAVRNGIPGSLLGPAWPIWLEQDTIEDNDLEEGGLGSAVGLWLGPASPTSL